MSWFYRIVSALGDTCRRVSNHLRVRKRTHAQAIVEAMEVGEGLLLSHVGDVNAMGSDQTAEALKRLDGDPALTFATIRVLAGVGAAFAMATAERSVERGTAQFDEEVARLLRGTVRELTFTANEP